MFSFFGWQHSEAPEEENGNRSTPNPEILWIKYSQWLYRTTNFIEKRIKIHPSNLKISKSMSPNHQENDFFNLGSTIIFIL